MKPSTSIRMTAVLVDVGSVWPHGGLDAVLRRWSVVKADPDDGWAYQSI